MARSPLKEGAQALIPDEYELVPQAHAIMLVLTPVQRLQKLIQFFKYVALTALILGILLVLVPRCRLAPTVLVSGAALTLTGGCLIALPAHLYGAPISLFNAGTAIDISSALTADIPLDIRLPGMILLSAGLALVAIGIAAILHLIRNERSTR